jgi:hypothetical protein
MPKKSSTPLIEYDHTAREAFAACLDYLKEAAAYVQGKRETLPDASRIVSARFPQSSIMAANLLEEARGLRWPAIEAVVEDRSAPPGEVRSNRYFDPWYFVAMLLMEIAGGRFRFDRSNRQRFFYLAYAGPVGREGNFYLRRIIANTPPWADTHEGEGKGGAHYDYRRPTLSWALKDVVKAMGKDTRRISRVREAAVQFAVQLFNRQMVLQSGGKRVTRASKMPGLNVSPAAYQELLGYALYVADAVHEKFSLDRRSAADGQP